MIDDARELLTVAESANPQDWEYKPAVWGEYGEPPVEHHKVTVRVPEIRFPNGYPTFPSVEYALTMPNIDILDAIHIATFDPPMMRRLLNRLIKAEATVDRLDALCEELGEGEGCHTGALALDGEPEYPLSYFQEALRTALDES